MFRSPIVRIHVLDRTQVLPGTPDEVFPFFADARNLEAITPPLLRFEVVTPDPIEMGVGTIIQYRLKLRGVPVGWTTSIQAWDPPHRFVDTQIRGPYALWHHTHTFEPHGDDQTLMRDTVRYAIGFGPFGDLSHRLFVKRDVEGIFDFRREAIVPLLAQAGGPSSSETSTSGRPSSGVTVSPSPTVVTEP
jgi:ligand-binding SRPBCC domain-containing protein